MAEELEVRETLGLNLQESPTLTAPETVEPDKEPDKPQWDKERQRRDQEHANERKMLLSQLESMQTERMALQSQMDELRRSQQDKKPAAADDIDTELPLDLDYEKLVQYSAKLAKTLREQRQQISKLESSVEQVSRHTSAAADKAAEQEILDRLAREYGEQYRNEAQTIAATWLAECGYTTNRPPDRPLVMLALRDSFRELKARDQTGQAKKATTLDTAKGGSAPQASIGEYENVDDAAEALIKAGKIG